MAGTSYNPLKTIAKGAEVPLVVVAGSKVLTALANNNGIDVEEETVTTCVAVLYGVVKGFLNWVKNRKNGKG